MEMDLCNDYPSMFDNITKRMLSYIVDNKIKSLVLGISGGVDSALLAALARFVCDKLEGKVSLLGRCLPISSNIDEMYRAELVGRAFCHNFKTFDMDMTFNDFVSQTIYCEHLGNLSFDEKVRLGNIKARLRMIKLYDEAHRNSGMVLSTDNFSEYHMGFWTLHGDVGDYAPLQEVWKTEVYGLARLVQTFYANNDESSKSHAMKICADAIPTDGLGITESDFDQLGVSSWQEVDRILIDSYLNFFDDNDPIIKRYRASDFKRNNPTVIERSKIIDNSNF